MTTQSKLLAFALALALPACGDTDENGDDPGAGNDFAEIAFDAARLTRDADAPNNSARPAGVAALGNKLFVALGNLTVDCMVPAGPGYLAVVDLAAAPEAGEAGYALIELPELLLCGGPEVSKNAFCFVSASFIFPLPLSASASQPSLSQQQCHGGTKWQQRLPGCLLWAYLLPRIMASWAPVALGALQHLQERYKKL